MWLKDGDKNTAFFHTSVKGRRLRNSIIGLQKYNGQWCQEEKQIQEEIISYYEVLFTLANPQHFEEVLSGIPTKIPSQMNADTTRPVSEKEIKRAIFSMDSNKALSQTVCLHFFFQKHWNIIKNDVVKAVQSFFHSGHLLKSVNETIITLVPKI
ncbi:hypothetical protein ACH5RR_003029 [Cinchona calisaya]|uniref:Uncharacterized protein n=1 Tax=Cinchona calisaya TaxID=153742 RepID=A0ABD3ATS7_9GENT